VFHPLASLHFVVLRLLRFCAAALAFLLAGCQGVHPVMDTALVAWPWRSQYAQLLPGFEYMVVTLEGRATVVVLGSREIKSMPDEVELHEYWYSSQKEMLHLVNGRIHTALGFTTEWRSQQANPPRWPDVAKSRYEVSWSRELDLMPGYRFGEVQHVWTQTIPEPSKLPEGVKPGANWFADDVQARSLQGRPWTFQQRFAVLNGQVVYSEQCLAPQVCFSLRPLAERGPP
jgi:hypothetical protein